MLQPQQIRQIQRHLGHVFQQEELLILALTHKSAHAQHYERLEFLGDALLDVYISEALYQKFPEANEGELSRMRSSLVREETLAEVARNLQLSEVLILGPGELKSGGYLRDSILSDVVESLLGAVYLDAGFEACRTVVLSNFDAMIQQATPELEKDPKTELQEYLQAQKQPLPTYKIASAKGKSHDQLFTVHCYIDSLEQPTVGVANSKKKAERLAAKQGLQLLQQVEQNT